MNITQAHGHQVLLRTTKYGADRADRFPAGELGGQMFAEVGRMARAVTEQGALQVDGDSGAREGTLSKAAASEALRETLDRIAAVGRVMAQDQPGLRGKFRKLRSHTAHALSHTARAYAKNAAPLAASFVAHGFAPTFLDDLAADLAAFEAAAADHAVAKGLRAASSVGIEAALEAGFRAVRRLDVIVANVFRNDPSELAAWKIARHIERTPQSKPDEPTPDAPAPTKTEAA